MQQKVVLLHVDSGPKSLSQTENRVSQVENLEPRAILQEMQSEEIFETLVMFVGSIFPDFQISVLLMLFSVVVALLYRIFSQITRERIRECVT